LKDPEILLTLGAVESLKQLRGKERQQVLSFIDALPFSPDVEGDFSEKDETGRLIQVKVIGRSSVVYWHDSPVREVRIIRITRT